VVVVASLEEALDAVEARSLTDFGLAFDSTGRLPGEIEHLVGRVETLKSESADQADIDEELAKLRSKTDELKSAQNQLQAALGTLLQVDAQRFEHRERVAKAAMADLIADLVSAPEMQALIEEARTSAKDAANKIGSLVNLVETPPTTAATQQRLPAHLEALASVVQALATLVPAIETPGGPDG